MAAPFTRTRPNEKRTPEFVELPDGRKRLTRFFDLADGDKVIDSLVEAYGTLDAGDTSAPCAGFAGLRLVDQHLDRDNTQRSATNPSVYTKVYEELAATAETLIGQPATIKLDDGRTALQTVHWQFVAGAFVPGTVGTTTYSGDASAYLQKVEAPNDGALRRITRTWVYEGVIATDEEIREGGALSILKFTSVKTAPATPALYTLIGKPTQNPNGLPVYTYAFAKGAGLVFTQTNDALNGRITYTTKRAYGTPSAATGEFETTVEQADGYTVYISRGIVINSADLPDEVTTRNKGALVLTRKRKINSAPTGSGSLILDTADPAEGYTLYTRAWAVGSGLVSTSNNDALNGCITYTVNRAYGANVAATGEFETTTEDDDGYTVYISRGIVINSADLPDEVTTRNKGALVLTRKRKINSAPTGTGELILDTADPAEGYTLYTLAWAVGSGLVSTSNNDALDGHITYTVNRAYGANVAATGEFETTTEDDDGYTVYISRGIVINSADLPDEVTTRNKGALVLTRKRKINSAPTGSGSLILDTADPAEGYTLYTRAWAVGSGLVSTSNNDALNGRITYTVKRAYGAASAATGEFETSTEDDDGYTVYISRGIVINSDDLPDEVRYDNNGALTVTTKRKINSAPTGSGVMTLDTASPAEGYTLYTRTFNVGTGTIESDVRAREDGSLVYTLAALAATGTVPAYPGAGTGYLVQESHVTAGSGYHNRAVYIKLPADFNLPRTVSFSVPGLATAANPPTFSPPVTRRLAATVYVAFATTKNADAPYSITTYAQLEEHYTRTDDGKQYAEVRALDSYVGSSTMTMSSGNYRGIDVTAAVITVGGSSPSTRPSGVTVLDAESELYLVDIAGTPIYRNTSIKFTF